MVLGSTTGYTTITGKHCLAVLNWSIVQLLNMQHDGEKKKVDQGFKSTHTTNSYQRLAWSPHPLSSASRRSDYVSGIHSLNHLQRESYLHLPVVTLMVLISVTRTLPG